MTVLNDEQIAKSNIVIASDLATYTPSLSVDMRYGPEKSSFALRGFNQDQNTAPTVGVYFADVVGVRAQGGTTSGNTVGAGSFVDLQNVQVLKGPQGTLFGRNTTGGAILLVPKKPTDFLEGYAEGTYGNYNQKRLQAALNVPLADTFKVRLAVDRNKRDGYVKNLSGIGDKDFYDVDYLYGRLSIVADLTPDLENYTIFHYSRSTTNGYGARLAACDREFASNPANIAASFTKYAMATAACDQLDRQTARGDGPLEIENGVPDSHIRLETWQVINTTTWTASDNLTVKNIASYGEFQEHSAFSIASTNFKVSDALTGVPGVTPGAPLNFVYFHGYPGYPAAGESTFTEELQLQGNTPDGRLRYVIGGYLEFSRPISYNSGRTAVYSDCSNPGTLTCNTPLGFAIISQSRNRFDFDDKGIFAQATYNLTDEFAITGGIRYTYDKIRGEDESTRYTFAPIPGLGTTIVSQVCNEQSGPRAGVDISDPIIFPGIGQVAGGDGSHDLSKCNYKLVESSKKPTWLINLEYKPTPDLMFYAKWARGYRQGGIVFTNPGLETFGPEKLDSYEAGAKATFRGAVPGYFNIAAFYNDFTDQQVITRSIAKEGSGLAGGNVIANAGKTEIYGVEVDAAATLFDSLALSLGYTYLHTEVKAFNLPTLPADSPFEALVPQTNVGDPLALSPKHRLTVSATYTLPIDESLGTVSFGATYNYTAKQIADVTSPLGVLPARNLLNLNFDWKNVGGSSFDLAAFATNVTNEIYRVGVGSLYASNGYETALYGQPRMYGVRVRWHFGT
ncbi:TonB-dependent receptor [Novosphingobium album (ex Hu et al. 2023)]|uniref:TonB-dependent receptor n=1 Tax=Novosphingobium album (ex Hu et al. 2023) TaxID=2930093 RepID=A0ABT0B5D2_9SPHN|nr:TonB-dependent receptor [Novosphingobium album (ex Hu et al. 2023)]MCJ2180250.1 TonB-dependent receptor [Novosphingobium album (ex Hu et al. 2023)]